MLYVYIEADDEFFHAWLSGPFFSEAALRSYIIDHCFNLNIEGANLTVVDAQAIGACPN